ncbi:Dual specificity protein kinase Ttk [Exaiptasia diaphana]|nr:Dual specificity protein kinase Ttk [Exaiptasia diaphana]
MKTNKLLMMLEAVNVIHNEGIIHSDLKPANFLFVEGRLKLIDFGIANSIQADQTSIQRDTQVGTLNFMSPEAFQDISGSMNPNTGRSRPCTKIGRPSDVWSLGCILYAMVYGRTPFQHITNQAMKLQCIIDENYAIEFPPIGNSKLLDVLKGSLIRNPRERYTIPHLLQHPFLSSGKAAEPNEEQLFNVLLELAQAHVNSPRSIRVASKSICEQLRSGNKIDVSSILVKKQHQSQHAPPSGRQPLGGLSMGSLQMPHSALKSSAPYMGNDRSYFDKENADLPFT